MVKIQKKSNSKIPEIDFLIVGAEKCGTTWLANMLKCHRDVFIPSQKELHYFNRKYVEFPELDNYNFDKSINWYLSFFDSAKPSQIKGEACPTYLWDTHAPYKIHKYYPNVKIIIVLRDPVERAFSAYRFYQQRGVISYKLSLWESVKQYSHHIIERSTYYKQVKKYVDLFPHSQVKVMFFDDLKKDNITFLTTIEDFLEVPHYIPPNIDKRSYVTGMSHSIWVNKLLAKLRYIIRKYHFNYLNDFLRNIKLAKWLETLRQRNKKRAKPTNIEEINLELKSRVYTLFEEDIYQLENLLTIDLKNWKPVSKTLK